MATPSARERILDTAARLFYQDGLRATGIDEVPQEVWALGEAVRVADFFGNRISALPAAVASLAAVTRVRLSDNKLTSPGVAGLYSCCMQCTAVECS